MTELRGTLVSGLLCLAMAAVAAAAPEPDAEFGNPWMANLVELDTPPPIPWWPPAPGWYALAAMAFLSLGWVGWRVVAHRRADGYRRSALRELAFIRRDRCISRLPELLRRTALAAYPRTRVAHLIGDEWLRFLDESAGMAEFQQAVGSDLVDLPYTPTPPDSSTSAAILAAAERWIRHHRRNPATEERVE